MAEKASKVSTQAKGPITIVVTCKGKSPILMNPATDELLDALISGVHKARQKDRPFEDIAQEKIIRNEKGEIGLKIEYLLACLKGGGRKVKLNGKQQISTATSTMLFALMEFEEVFLPFKKQKEQDQLKTDPLQEYGWVVDKRKGSLPKDGTAVGILRPRFDNWEFDVTIKLDPNEIDETTARKLFDEAGSKVGLGDFRPSCNGPFGRFMVSAWVKKESKAEKNGEASKEVKEEAAAV